MNPGNLPSRRRGARAHTLPELMISISIFSVMIGGLILVNIFGMKQDELANSKLGANDQSRKAFELLLYEIRSGKNVRIGSGNFTNFTDTPDGQPQRGNALQIYPSTNNNVFIRYYFWTNDLDPLNVTNELRRYFSVESNYTIVANHLTNDMAFEALDYTNNPLTVAPEDYNHNYMISTRLQFFQYQYPLTRVGPGYFYNYYQLQFKATRRSP